MNRFTDSFGSGDTRTSFCFTTRGQQSGILICLIVLLRCASMANAQGGWVRQNLPRLPHGTLRAVDALDAQTAIILDDTVTLRTSNGGAVWSPAPSLLVRPHGVRYLTRTTLLGLVGTGVVRSEDAGNSWTPVFVLPQGKSASIYSADFTDTLTGAATGLDSADSVVFISTHDGGATWQRGSSAGLPYGTSAIAIIDQSTYVVACTDTILRTTDGGAHWHGVSINSGSGSGFYGIAFSSPGTGVCVGPYGRIVASTDSGKSWRDVPSNAAGRILYDVRAIDTSTFVAVGDSGCVLRSTNNGVTWTRRFTGTQFWLEALSHARSQTVYAVGRSGVIVHSSDGGARWDIQSDIRENLSSIAFADSSTEIACGFSGTIVRTSDAGAHWSRSISSTTAALAAAACPTLQRCVIAGDSGAVLVSTDAGLTWQRRATGTTARFRAVAFGSAGSGLAVGDSGTIARTSDGGDTWAATRFNAALRFVAVAFADSRVAVAIGQAYRQNNYFTVIARSTDAGASWTAVDTVDHWWLSAITFPTATFGIAVGTAYGGGADTTSLRTTDGGVHWFGMRAPGGEPRMTIMFASAGAGFGDGGRTTNGGATWLWMPPFIAGTQAGVPAGLAVRTTNTAALVGSSGAIYRTDDGGGQAITRYRVSPKSIDFGDRPLNSFLIDSVAIDNDDTDTLFVGSSAIPPGQRAYFQVYASVKDTARHTQVLHLSGNADMVADSVVYTWHGVAAIFGVNMPVVLFDQMPVNSTATDTLYIINRGNLPLHISRIRVDDPHFHFAPDSGVVGVGDSLAVTISIHPDSVKFYGAYMHFEHDGISKTDSVWMSADVISGVHDFATLPGVPLLAPIHPNPAITEATIEFALPREQHAVLTAASVDGGIVRTLLDTRLPAGWHSATWTSASLPPGAYVVTLRTSGGVVSRVVVIM